MFVAQGQVVATRNGLPAVFRTAYGTSASLLFAHTHGRRIVQSGVALNAPWAGTLAVQAVSASARRGLRETATARHDCGLFVVCGLRRPDHANLENALTCTFTSREGGT